MYQILTLSRNSNKYILRSTFIHMGNSYIIQSMHILQSHAKRLFRKSISEIDDCPQSVRHWSDQIFLTSSMDGKGQTSDSQGQTRDRPRTTRDRPWTDHGQPGTGQGQLGIDKGQPRTDQGQPGTKRKDVYISNVGRPFDICIYLCNCKITMCDQIKGNYEHICY